MAATGKAKYAFGARDDLERRWKLAAKEPSFLSLFSACFCQHFSVSCYVLGFLYLKNFSTIKAV
jgi:hypothetical protein